MTGRMIAGVDVGGTFTDFFCFDTENRTFKTFKVSSHRGDEAQGFIHGLERIGNFEQIASIIHGTTAGTNALLERKLAKTGIIMTKGFRDTLEMRRRDRPRTWGLWDEFIPVVERDMRLEVNERTLADGTIRQSVDPEDIQAKARQLLDMGAQALAIVFINSYANNQNELAALDAAKSIWPNAYIAASSQILPEIREFERTSTSVLNAALQPVVGSYLENLENTLEQNDFGGSFHIVQSNGGVMSTELARRLPVRTALSGPAAGVIAAKAIAKAAGYPNIITGDLGGTSFDVALIRDGQVAQTAQSTIDFGLVIRTPMIEITTIGAGGGSIARVDKSGLLEVGPQSAGSVPGPVCYGQGNTEPTLTDANIVLGRIDASRPIGQGMSLDVDAARQSIEENIGSKLGLDTMTAAQAIVRVANAHLAGAIRLVSIERGHDPGLFSFMPFGGGGALHAGQLLRDVGLPSAIIPRFPGITSALGCIIADLRHDHVQTINTNINEINAPRFLQRMKDVATDLGAVIETSGIDIDGAITSFELDMQYAGQTHTISVPLGINLDGDPQQLHPARLQQAFENEYRSQFNRLLENTAIRIVSLRTIATGNRPAFDLAALAPKPDASVEKARMPRRRVWFVDDWHETDVFARLDLPVGARINGPAILDQPDATIVIDPGMCGQVDSFGNIILERS